MASDLILKSSDFRFFLYSLKFTEANFVQRLAYGLTISSGDMGHLHIVAYFLSKQTIKLGIFF